MPRSQERASGRSFSGGEGRDWPVPRVPSRPYLWMEPCPRSSSAWRVREARGPVPQEAAFPSGQATPLASRRAALAKAGPFAYKTSHHGAWRSMVAHLLWEQGVAGSNPVAPTIHKNKRSAVTGWPLFVFSAAKICLRAQEQTCSASGQAGQCRICPVAAAGGCCIRRKAFGGKSYRGATSVRCAFRQKERAAGFAAGCPGS